VPHLFLMVAVGAFAEAPRPNLYILGIAIDQEGVAGGWAQAGAAQAWKDTIAGTSLEGKIYTVESTGRLYVTDPATGEWQPIGKPEFANVTSLFAAGKGEDARLYALEKDGSLYRINFTDGTWGRVGRQGGWKATIAAAAVTAADGAPLLYTVERGGALYVTSLVTGQFHQVGRPGFGNTRLLYAAGNDRLCTIEQDGSLYRIDARDGTWKKLGASFDWKRTLAGAILDGKLYTTEGDGALYETDLDTGKWTQIGKNEFGSTKFMFATGDHLATIEESGNLYRVAVKTAESIDWFDWCPLELERAFREQGKPLYASIDSRQILGPRATHDEVMRGFAWLASKARAGDIVLVFVDAHGGTDAQKGWGICTADGQTLWGREIKESLYALPCEAIVMVETCGSGGFAHNHPLDIPLPRNVTAVCACSARQSADNQLDLALAEALYGRADFNHDGTVDVDELTRYVRLRYAEWSVGPDGKHVEGSDAPVIVQSKDLAGTTPLTQASPQLVAVSSGDDYWSAVLLGREGDRDSYRLHLLGWSSKAGDPYFRLDRAPRDRLCLPDDGPPLLVEVDGTWKPARLLAQEGEQYRVHLLGLKRDAVVGKAHTRQVFGATVEAAKRN
jgi:hypothetical protein